MCFSFRWFRLPHFYAIDSRRSWIFLWKNVDGPEGGTNGDRTFIILSWARAVRRDMILEVVGRLLTFDFRALYCYSRRMPD